MAYDTKKRNSRTKIKLDARRKAFCREYIKDYNAHNAAIRAKYSRVSASSMGPRLLAIPEVRAEIRRLQDKQSEDSFITCSRIESELAKLAFSNVMDYVDVKELIPMGQTGGDEGSEDGQGPKYQYVEVKDLTRLDTAAISEIHQTKYGIRIKLHAKDAALEKLMRRKGMFDIDNTQRRPIIIVGDEEQDFDEIEDDETGER